MAIAPGRIQRKEEPAPPGQPPIRLMIVDDSQIARTVLSRMVASHPDFHVVAQAGNADEALDALKSVCVDIILLDLEMPGRSGLDALPEILRCGNGARVLIVSSLAEDGAEATVRALSLGAADTLPKPGSASLAGRFSDVLAARLRALGRVERAGIATALPITQATIPTLTLRAMPNYRLGCLALGASTGGLHALSEFLEALPPTIGAPILITQHLPPVFMPFFAKQIASASGRQAVVAEENMLVQPERVIIAPGDAHLELHRHGGTVRVKLTRGPVSSGCMPSADPMLWSVARAYSMSGLGIVFSGMGRDGLVGSSSLVTAGGAVLVQDQQTSAVWGMPRAVAEAGLASAVLSPKDLARRVAARAQEGGK